jgi:haloalkane dehalogenase
MRKIEAWTRAFTGPVTLVWGERDPILGRALARHQRALPMARVVTTAAGHFLQEEVAGVLATEIRRLVER